MPENPKSSFGSKVDVTRNDFVRQLQFKYVKRKFDVIVEPLRWELLWKILLCNSINEEIIIEKSDQVFQDIMICQSQMTQMTLLANHKSRQYACPRPMIVKYTFIDIFIRIAVTLLAVTPTLKYKLT